jgi:hypothetical protein
MTLPKFRTENGWTAPADPVPWAGVVLLVLAGVMLVEAIRALLGEGQPPRGVARRLEAAGPTRAAGAAG